MYGVYEIINSGLKYDIELLCHHEFQGADEDLVNLLYNTMSVLKIAHKTFSEETWIKCFQTYGVSMSNYRQINHYLESRLSGRQKTDLYIRNKKSQEQKILEMTRFVTPSKIDLFQHGQSEQQIALA